MKIIFSVFFIPTEHIYVYEAKAALLLASCRIAAAYPYISQLLLRYYSRSPAACDSLLRCTVACLGKIEVGVCASYACRIRQDVLRSSHRNEESTGGRGFYHTLLAHGREIYRRNGILPRMTSSWRLIETDKIKMREKSSKR
jgi:hypothetical protein